MHTEHRVGVRLAILLAAVGGLLSLGPVDAGAALTRCHDGEQECRVLTVPIDRSGAVPGTVSLRIDLHQASSPKRPPLVVLAGNAGQSTTYGSDEWWIRQSLGVEARFRDVVVIDPRGTGGSGVIRCRALERSLAAPTVASVEACAKSLGPRRAFYSSVDQADDVEAVRQALGAPRIAIWGNSYGTFVAQAYARRYPDRVERLLLDSVVAPAGLDVFGRSSMRAVPRVAGAFCGSRCRDFTESAADDIARLASQVESRPLRGRLVGPSGKRLSLGIDGRGLLELATAGDLDPLTRAMLPGAVRGALEGDPVQLLRAKRWARRPQIPPGWLGAFSAGAYLATVCEDTVLPWGDDTPVAARLATAAALVDAQPAGAFAPFGPRTVLESAVIDLCEGWPASHRPHSPPAPLPDVPALVLSGNLDVRAPVADARAVAALMPQAQLLVVRNMGHGVLDWGLSKCARRAASRFLAGGATGDCPAVTRLLSPLSQPPRAISELPAIGNVGGRRGRTLSAVWMTIDDALLSTLGELMVRIYRAPVDSDPFRHGLRAGALRGGTYAFDLDADRYTFRKASVVPGVHVTGAFYGDGHRRPRATFRVSGPAAADGWLRMRRRVLVGRLGGRLVRARHRRAHYDLFGIGARASSSWVALRARQLDRSLPYR